MDNDKWEPAQAIDSDKWEPALYPRPSSPPQQSVAILAQVIVCFRTARLSCILGNGAKDRRS